MQSWMMQCKQCCRNPSFARLGEASSVVDNTKQQRRAKPQSRKAHRSWTFRLPASSRRKDCFSSAWIQDEFSSCPTPSMFPMMTRPTTVTLPVAMFLGTAQEKRLRCNVMNAVPSLLKHPNNVGQLASSCRRRSTSTTSATSSDCKPSKDRLQGSSPSLTPEPLHPELGIVHTLRGT